MSKPEITHIFFDLHNTLVDGRKLHPCYSAAYGRLMAERYGLEAEVWAQANRRIFADWDSYYADLDLEGDDGLAHMWEGLFRTTRAMFRIVGVPEPTVEELRALSREAPGYATQRCDAFYDDAKSVVQRIFNAGYRLGVVTHAISAQAQGTLVGGGMEACFSLLICPDVVGQFSKDETFFAAAVRAAQVNPRHCMVVDDSIHALRAARRIGLTTAHILRNGGSPFTRADCVLIGTLKGLLTYLKVP